MCGAAISFVIGLIKSIDQRNREQEQRQHEAFHRMICIASGSDESGNSVRRVQQIAAIYQSQAYKKYSFASVPVLRFMLKVISGSEDARMQQFIQPIDETIGVLTNK